MHAAPRAIWYPWFIQQGMGVPCFIHMVGLWGATVSSKGLGKGVPSFIKGGGSRGARVLSNMRRSKCYLTLCLWSRVHIVYDGATLYSRSTSWRWQFLSKNLENFQQNLYQNFLDFSRFGLSIKNWKLDFYPPPPRPTVKGLWDVSRFGLSIKSWKLAVTDPPPPHCWCVGPSWAPSGGTSLCLFYLNFSSVISLCYVSYDYVLLIFGIIEKKSTIFAIL